jgi:site-specific recombinase XerD
MNGGLTMSTNPEKYGSIIEFPPAQVDALESLLLQFDRTIDDFLDWVQGQSTQLIRHGTIESISLTEVFGAFRLSLSKPPTTHHKKLCTTSVRDYERIVDQLQPYCIAYTGGFFDPLKLAEACLEFVISIGETDKAKTTINKWTAVIRRFLQFVQFTYATGEIPLPEFEVPDEPLPIAFDGSQIQELLMLANRADHPIRAKFLISFLLATGLRRDEFRLVQRKDVDLHRRTVKVRHAKNGRMREVPFASAFSDEFMYYFDIYGVNHPEHYIYGHKQNLFMPVSNSSINDTFRRLAKKMKGYVKGDPVYGYHLHCLRHTYATYLLRKKVSLRVISQLLGHSSMRSTLRYTVLNTEQLREDAREGFAFLEKILLGEPQHDAR